MAAQCFVEEQVPFEKLSWFEMSQSIGAGVAAVTHSDRVVPASGGHGPDVCGAGVTHALSTGSAVVLGHGCSEDLGALVALGDVLVRNPVVGPSHILHKT